MIYRLAPVFAIALVCAVLATSTAHAAPGPAVTSISDVDEDFWLMGEYVGSTVDGTRLGLQVIALGEGEFDAIALPGGLPGNGWDRSTRHRLSGTREGNSLSLVGESHQIAIQNNQAEVKQGDRMIATLQKVTRRSVAEGQAPPANAVVLFDGSNTDAFENGKIKEGLMQVGADLKQPYANFRLHVEFKTPYMPSARGQGRGNSGIYIQSRYEVQVLDSFGLDGVKNECGGLYKQKAPDVNMAFPPLSWQTYDIIFCAAQFDGDGNKVKNAQITVLHNGVRIHDNYEIVDKTGAGKKEGPDPLPTRFQDHSNPVEYRNIWLQEL